MRFLTINNDIIMDINDGYIIILFIGRNNFMKTKRILSLLLVFVMSLGVLAGCGGKKTNVEELPEGTVTLTVGIPQKATVS